MPTNDKAQSPRATQILERISTFLIPGDSSLAPARPSRRGLANEFVHVSYTASGDARPTSSVLPCSKAW